VTPTRPDMTSNPDSTKKALLRKSKEVALLSQIAESISSHLGLEQILKEIIGLVVRTTGADACLIYLLDESKKELVLRASQNPHPKLIGRIRLEWGEGITGWVAKERQIVSLSEGAYNDPRFSFFNNLPEDMYEAFLSVPVISKSGVVGVINVQHKKRHRYSETAVAMMRIIGHQVGYAIENGMLYSEMAKKAMQMDTLFRVSHTVAANHYLEESLHLIVTMTAGMMGSKICSIMGLDEHLSKQGGELKILATQSLSEAYRRKASVKVGESVSGRVVKTGRPMMILDVKKDPLYAFPELAKKEGLCSLLSVPMVIKDRVVGVINSYTSQEHSFSVEETSLLQTVANQAAMMIENARLLEQSNAMKEALVARKVVERAKAILMREAKIGEEAAFSLIQRKSMNHRKSMREVSEAIILASEIQKP